MTKPEVKDEEEFGTIEDLEVAATTKEPEQEQPASSDDDTQADTTKTAEIPGKYKDKTPAELIRMHQEAESALGRSGSEVGQLRATIDQYIQSRTQQAGEDAKDEGIDFDEDPEGAIKQAVANNPELKAIKKKLADRERQEGLDRLKENYKVADILTDPKFAEWVNKSKVRSRLFQAADKGYDWEAAEELFEGWTERQNLQTKVLEATSEDRKAEVAKASTGSTEGSAASTRSKKKFRRTDIIKLMNDDPKRYQALLPEIRAAYAEKRVV